MRAGPQGSRVLPAREPMGRWSAESEALGLVQLKGRVVPGEVGRAQVTCRCVTGLGESHPLVVRMNPGEHCLWRSGKQSL
jgi:hypothetical protein